jgi:hypothetical protein
MQLAEPAAVLEPSATGTPGQGFERQALVCAVTSLTFTVGEGEANILNPPPA